jgi:hypothetical protein
LRELQIKKGMFLLLSLFKNLIMCEPNSIGKEDGDANRVTRGEGEKSVNAEGRGACVESSFGAHKISENRIHAMKP